MKFNDYQYERPNVENVTKEVDALLKRFNSASTFEDQSHILNQAHQYFLDVFTNIMLVKVRYDLDMSDAYYAEENKFMDYFKSVFSGYVFKFYKSLLSSPFKDQLGERFGNQLMILAETTTKTFTPGILELLQEENNLVSKHARLKASAIILYEGGAYNLQEMAQFTRSLDRETRRKANLAVSSFYREHEDEFDTIFDHLVRVRTAIGKELGYHTFTEVGYQRLNRSDYAAGDVAVFRQMLLKWVGPILFRTHESQKKALGYQSIMYYDENIRFSDGVPKVVIPMTEYVEVTKKVFSEMSEETSAFFKCLTSTESLDLKTRKNKASGAYCTIFPRYQTPYIFLNSNGSAGDIETLMHESGHGLQQYLSRNFEVPQYFGGTAELCEIHSMAMEFLSWPWMEAFFGDDTEKFKYNHLVSSVEGLLYQAAVDEFQHDVYDNPRWTPNERKLHWRKLEKKYLPQRDYGDDDFLAAGTYWYRQNHIFASPFYYIDYALALVSALEIWIRSSDDHEGIWNNYVSLCELGGSVSYFKALKASGLSNPFEEETLAFVFHRVRDWIVKSKGV